MTARLMLLDSASLYFRAYFGVPETLRAPDGTPVNAVRGLLDFIARLVADHSPTHLVACLDADWRPQWRVDLVPTYKAHRVAEEQPDGDAGEAEEVPDTLAPQVPVILDVLDALGIARAGVPDYEADDVIAAYAAHPERACGTAEPSATDVVTGDRDLFQLVDDGRGVRVLYPIRGVGTLQLTDEALLREKYGVDGPGYADLALLRGDPSDGLPGVQGVGEKTAAKLLAEYGDVPGIFAAVDDPASKLTKSQRTRLSEGRDYVSRAARVVKTASDAPVPELDARLPRYPADPAALGELAGRWGLGGSVDRVVAALADG